MKKQILILDDITYKMIEEITKHHNDVDRFNASFEETLIQLIQIHHMVEIKLKKDNQ